MIGSLCSGYGGLDRAVEDVFDVDTAWHCEIDPAPATVLAARWPGVPNLRDVRTVDWTRVEPVDVLTAGYPCQPFSLAGQRKGTADERHLWPHIAVAVRELRPGLVVLENVPGHRHQGFGDVLGDLAGLGYDTSWASVRACDVGAPHRRERVFIAAADTRGEAGRLRTRLRQGETDRLGRGRPDDHNAAAAADTEHGRRRRRPRQPLGQSAGRAAAAGPSALALFAVQRPTANVDWQRYEPAIRRWEHVTGRPAPAPAIRGPLGGPRLSPLFVEWLMGLPEGFVVDVAGVTYNEQLRMLGNGVVPQQATAALHILTERTAA